ncbi:MAG: hypothetical protein CL471_08535 [Acidobacteria bacterium]|nr:hypothetical protein [Acidobacteriota bacterium]
MHGRIARRGAATSAIRLYFSTMALETNPPLEPLDRGRPQTGILNEERVSLWEHISVLYRHRRVAGTIFALVTIVGALQTFTTVPTYRATAQILLQEERTTTVLPFDEGNPFYWSDPEPYFQTQYRILQGRGLARRVVGRPEIARSAELRGEGPTTPTIGGALASIRTWISGLVGSDRAPCNRSSPSGRISGA